MHKYLNLKITAPKRLEILRKAAEKLISMPHRGDMETTWRTVRYAKFTSELGLHQGRNGDTSIWYCHTGEAFPREQFADDVIRLEHNGWFSDIYCAETYRGIIVRLPHGRCLAGYLMSGNGERVYYPEIYADADEAARAADGHAEWYAQEAREYDAKWQEARTIEDATETAFSRLRECLALRNNDCFADLRDEAREPIETIRDNRERLQNEFADVL